MNLIKISQFVISYCQFTKNNLTVHFEGRDSFASELSSMKWSFSKMDFGKYTLPWEKWANEWRKAMNIQLCFCFMLHEMHTKLCRVVLCCMVCSMFFFFMKEQFDDQFEKKKKYDKACKNQTKMSLKKNWNLEVFASFHVSSSFALKIK